MEILVNENIELRQLCEEDAIDIFNTIDSQREYLGVWLPFVESTKSVSDTQKFVDFYLKTVHDTNDFVFTIRYKSVFAGIIGFKSTDLQNRKTEIGYWLSYDFQKKGIVVASVKRLMEYAFETMDINRIQIKLAVGNERSKRIPEKLGFKLEGVERAGELLSGGVFADLYVYSKLKVE